MTNATQYTKSGSIRILNHYKSLSTLTPNFEIAGAKAAVIWWTAVCEMIADCDTKWISDEEIETFISIKKELGEI